MVLVVKNSKKVAGDSKILVNIIKMVIQWVRNNGEHLEAVAILIAIKEWTNVTDFFSLPQLNHPTNSPKNPITSVVAC